MPKRVPYLLVDAFTTTPGAGNRAGVVLEAAELSPTEMQRAAAVLRVSETVFVVGGGADHRVRYYTPTQEVEFCGHATVALGLALAASARLGEEAALDTLAGRVPLALELENGEARRVWMRQPEPRFRPLPPEARGALAEALGVDARTIHRALPLGAAHTGLWTAFLPLIDAGILDALEPDFAAIAALCEAWGVSSVHPYAATSPASFAARDFAPLLGILEDPVTGSAAGALAALLARAGVLPRRGDESEVVFAQGHAMGSPGEVRATVSFRNRQPASVRVGGCAVMVYEGVLEL